jgi:type IV secretory pathway VirB2 component (pilin)
MTYGHTLPATYGSAIPAASGWIEGLLLGNVATGIGILAVAGAGLLMLQGHFPFARGLRVVLGCFILFGSGAIAAGLMGIARSDRQSVHVVEIPQGPAVPPAPASAAPNADPYAGASVPR